MGGPLGSDWRTEAHGNDHLCLKHWLLLTWASWGEISDLEIGLAPTMQERRDVLERRGCVIGAGPVPTCRVSVAKAAPELTGRLRRLGPRWTFPQLIHGRRAPRVG